MGRGRRGLVAVRRRLRILNIDRIMGGGGGRECRGLDMQ